jgi:hypothetical protein
VNAQRMNRDSSCRAAVLVAAFASFALLITGFGAAPAWAVCPNEAIREAQGSETMALPDCMALEMVSPPQKSGQPTRSPEVSANGERVVFYSVAALGGTLGVHDFFNGDPYVATRGESGWTTAPTAPPPEIVRGWFVTPNADSFSPELSSWFQLAATLPQHQQGIARVFQGGLGGLFSPLSPPMVPLNSAGTGASGDTRVVDDSRLSGASADHSHFYFTPGNKSDNEGNRIDTGTAYLAGDPEPTGMGANLNTYLAQPDSNGEPSLKLLARDSGGEVWGGNCGTRLGGLGGVGGTNRGAVSSDGTRVYFSTRPSQPSVGPCETTTNKLRILMRSETGAGPEIEELFSPECTRISPPCDTSNGDDLYQGASVDQTKVYFTTTRQLVNSDLDTTSDLYLFDSTKPLGERLAQVSAGGTGDLSPGSGANVSSAAAISGDGSHVYFTSNSVLTTAKNPVGAEAQVGKPNLYLYEPEDPASPGQSKTAFIGTVEGGVSDAYPVPLTAQDLGGVEIGGDGHILLFETKAALVSTEDADGTHLDAYRYNAEMGQLRCASCLSGNPDGVPLDISHNGSAGTRGTTDFAERDRWVSEDGESVAFTTAEALVAADENNVIDSYLWRKGQLYLLPGTNDDLGHLRDGPVLSHDGSEVAFRSFAQLLPQDGDSAIDTYVARVDGGYLVPAPPVPCKGEGCQEPFKAQPGGQGSASEPPTAGNARELPKKCKKGFVRKHGRCIKRPHRKHGRAANKNRRAAK